MKRAERRHLKENELTQLAASARDAVETRGKQLIGITIALILVLAVGFGYFFWKGRAEGRADAMLADAMSIEDATVGPPQAPGSTAPQGLTFPSLRDKYQAMQTKFKAVADAYPSSDSGIFARYREAATLVALGNPTDAIAAYQEVVDKGGDSLYGQMARLGLAEAQAQAGQYEPAINSLKDLSQRTDTAVPVDGVLIRLARIYLDAGQTSDAEQTFNKLLAEHPGSLFAADARRELDQLKKS
jgi:TolA-binding protein